MQHDWPVGREETLAVSWRFEALHTSLPLTRGLVGVFGTVVQRAVLSMFHIRQDLANRRPIATQPVRDDQAGYVGQPL